MNLLPFRHLCYYSTINFLRRTDQWEGCDNERSRMGDKLNSNFPKAMKMIELHLVNTIIAFDRRVCKRSHKANPRSGIKSRTH